MVYGGSQGTSQIVASSFFLLLALITVILRLVVRVGNLKTFGIDDGLICAALCCSVAHLGLIVLEVMHGQGRTDNLPHDQITILKRAIYISIPIYCTALALTKLAILFLYLRFFQGKVLRRFTIGLIVFVSAYGCASIFTATFLCMPMKAFWDSRVSGRCLNRIFVWFMNAAVALATDIIVLILPMPILWGLKVPKRQRFELIGVFAFGLVACIISTLRLHALYIISTSHDSARDNGSAAVWSSVEVDIGIVCSSLPILRASFVSFVHKLRNKWRTLFWGSHRASEEIDYSPNDVSSAKSAGIMRSISYTITATESAAAEARRRQSIIPFEKVWDGAGAESWIAIERWKSTSSSV